MSASRNICELTEQCVITPTCTATVSDILLKKMCMFFFEPIRDVVDAWEALESYFTVSLFS